MDAGAAECAAAPDAARTRCHHGPSPGSAARGRTGRGAPTCNSARVSECEKGEAMRGCLVSSLTTLINLNRNHLGDYFSQKYDPCLMFSKTQQRGSLRRKAPFWFDLLGMNTSSPINSRSWPVGFPTGLWPPVEIYLNLQSAWRNGTRQVFCGRKSNRMLVCSVQGC